MTVEGMWAFFGLIFWMGIIRIDDLDNYWSTDVLFCLPLARSVMTRDRFCLILSFFHLEDNNLQLPKDHPDHDHLFKIRGFVESLRENFKQAYLPGKNIAIDEAMVAWRGHLAFRVYNPDKPDKFGIKVFELCDSANSYCCNFEFYTGKSEASRYGATFDVVDRLIGSYMGCGRTLYVDNYYTSPNLFSHLKQQATLACGMMRLNRKNGPPKSMLHKLKKSDTNTSALTNGNLNLLRFFDKREVNVLTTAYGDTKVATGKVNPVTKEPIIKLHDTTNTWVPWIEVTKWSLIMLSNDAR
ncbi:PiggyBac transposable element-derived protein 4-like [Plakobranchus ocellatus]|uniref:PiggyBac transposable element-derived protein 4-like n=1 Tax=Plakobranchus ocellatus TaxID=259542 RepID=A0AAV4BL39_9GAST|nr:PiggyBac transposable element-derived protein 4-like [Plakobranchus ocellatus]